MTYKFVGALKGITDDQPHVMKALWLGIGMGLVIEIVRKLVKANAAYQRSRPRAARFRGRLPARRRVPALALRLVLRRLREPAHVAVVGAGGVLSSFVNTVAKRKPRPGDKAMPEDMSTTSLVGGGLIAGDSLAALGLGIVGAHGDAARAADPRPGERPQALAQFLERARCPARAAIISSHGSAARGRVPNAAFPTGV